MYYVARQHCTKVGLMHMHIIHACQETMLFLVQFYCSAPTWHDLKRKTLACLLRLVAKRVVFELRSKER